MRWREKGKKDIRVCVISLEHFSSLLEADLQVQIPRVWSRLAVPCLPPSPVTSQAHYPGHISQRCQWHLFLSLYQGWHSSALQPQPHQRHCTTVLHIYVHGVEKNKTAPTSQPWEWTHDMPTIWQRILHFISVLLALPPISHSFYWNFTFILCFTSCTSPPFFPFEWSVLNTMWLSLMAGSNVLVWASLTVSKKQERCLIIQWGDICNALEGKLSHFGHKLWLGCHHGLCFSKRKSIWTINLLLNINLPRVVSMTRLNLAHNQRDKEGLMCIWFHKCAINVKET